MTQEPLEIREVPDDAVLTQHGQKSSNAPTFRNRIRAAMGEIDMSLIWGKLDARQASIKVRKHVVPGADVRYTTAGAFREQGFIVEHTPTKRDKDHVSVKAPLAEGEREHVDWDNDLAKLFDACFTEQREVITGE